MIVTLLIIFLTIRILFLLLMMIDDLMGSYICKAVEFDTSHDYRGVPSHREPVTLVLSIVCVCILICFIVYSVCQ